MTKRDKVGDLVARSDNTNRKKSVRDRVLQRKKILTTWMKEGVPDNKRSELPRSLRQAADWSDDELGIHRIKSPNDFTKTHPVWGKQVSEIASLITLLVRSTRGPVRKHKNDASFVRKVESQELEAQLVSTVSQWHSERYEALSQKARADSADSRSAQLLEENRKKDEEIADLRGQLLQRVGLKSV